MERKLIQLFTRTHFILFEIVLFPISVRSVNDVRRVIWRPWRREDGVWKLPTWLTFMGNTPLTYKEWKFPPLQTSDNHSEWSTSALTFSTFPGRERQLRTDSPVGTGWVWPQSFAKFRETKKTKNWPSHSLLRLFNLSIDYLLDFLHVCQWINNGSS